MKKNLSLRLRNFSMVEILVVISIVVILLGVMTTALGTGAEKRKGMATRGEMSKMEMALEQYQVNKGLYPTTSGYIKTIPELSDLLELEVFETDDAWGNPIKYVFSGNYADYSNEVAVKFGNQGSTASTYYNHRSYQLISAGEDGDFGFYPSAGLALPEDVKDNITNFELAE